MTRPTTDSVLISLHWAVAGGALASALTGLRLAADDPDAWLAPLLRPITLGGNVHAIHLISSFVMIGAVAGYVAYLAHTGSFGSLRVPKRRVSHPKAVWKVRNIRLYHLMFLFLGGLMATGLSLFFGWQVAGLVPLQTLAQVHVLSCWGLVATVILHVVAQYEFGAVAGRGLGERARMGADWLLKMLRPAILYRSRATRPDGARLNAHPLTLVAAGAAALTVGGGYAAYEGIAHQTLPVAHLGEDAAPVLDGIADEPVWARAETASVVTFNGANLGGGQSRVDVQAATDGETMFFRFSWEDPTRSFTHLPLQKTPGGWRLMHEGYDIEDEDIFYEDKFSVLLTTWADIGGGVTHYGTKPLANFPGPMSGRGLHYTTDGSIADMWQWKAVRSQPLGGLDDDSFGPPAEPNEKQLAGKKRYKGGYVTDPGSISSSNNFASEGPGGYAGEVLPKFLPRDYAALQARLGPIELDPDVSDAVPLAMYAEEIVPYSEQADAAIPVGAVIPGIVIEEGGIQGDRGDVATGAQWSDGRWTLETARALDTGSLVDTAFEPGRSVFLWVAVFDRTQTRHSRHMRPILVQLPHTALRPDLS